MQSVGVKTISIFAAFASDAAVVHGLRVGVGSLNVEPDPQPFFVSDVKQPPRTRTTDATVLDLRFYDDRSSDDEEFMAACAEFPDLQAAYKYQVSAMVGHPWRRLVPLAARCQESREKISRDLGKHAAMCAR